MKLKLLSLFFLFFSLQACKPEESEKPIVPFSLSVVEPNSTTFSVKDTLIFSIEGSAAPTAATSFTLVSSKAGNVYFNDSWQITDSISSPFSNNTTLLFVPLSGGTYNIKFTHEKEEIYNKEFSISDKPLLTLISAIDPIAIGSFRWLPYTVSDESSSNSFEVISKINNIQQIDTLYLTDNIFRDSVKLSNDIARDNSLLFSVKSLSTGETNSFNYSFSTFSSTNPLINFTYKYDLDYPGSDTMLESLETNVDGISYTAVITAKPGRRIHKIERQTEGSLSTIYQYDYVTDVLSYTDRGEVSEGDVQYKLGFSLIQYQHTIDYDDKEFWSVIRKDSHTYSGTKDTLTATLKAGYEFIGWFDINGNKLSEANPYPYVMPAADFYIQARASSDARKVTINATPGGTVTNPGGMYEYGAQIKVTAIPDDEYRLEAWYEGTKLFSRAADLNFTVQRAISIEARFEENINAVRGSTPYGCTITGYGDYNENDDVTLSITVPEGKEFLGWRNGQDVISMDNPYTFKMPSSTVQLDAYVSKAPKRRIMVGFLKMDDFAVRSAYVTYLNRDIDSYGDVFIEGATAALSLQDQYNGGYRFEWWVNGNKVGEGSEHISTIKGDMNYTIKIYTNWFDVNLKIGKADATFGIDEPGDFGTAYISKDHLGNPVNLQSIRAPYGQMVTITANSINDTKVINAFWREGLPIAGGGGTNINQTSNTDVIRVKEGTNNIDVLFAKKYHILTGNRFSSPTGSNSEIGAKNHLTHGAWRVIGEPMRIYANMNSGYEFEGWYNYVTGALISRENPYITTYYEDVDIIFELRVK